MDKEKILQFLKENVLVISLGTISLILLIVIICMATKTKDTWPELNGINKDCAQKVIFYERPDLKIVYGLDGTAYMTKYDKNQVRIVYDKDGMVVQVPKIG